MSAPTDILDSLLPLLQPEGRELHLKAAIVEVAEPAQLVELAANPRIRRFLLARLSDTAVPPRLQLPRFLSGTFRSGRMRNVRPRHDYHRPEGHVPDAG